MKTAALLLVTTSLLARYVAQGADLVAFWQAEDDALDSVGDYHGSIVGGASFAAGQVGRAFAFDGSSGWVIAWPSTNLQLLAGATLMAWIRLDRLPSEAGHFMYVVGRSQVGNDLDMQIESDNRARFYIGAGTRVSSISRIETGAWCHIAATYRPAQSIELFLNGAREGFLNTSIVVSSNANPFSVGASTVFSGRYLEGRIDQVRLYDSALSGSEIETVYASEAGTLPHPHVSIRVSQVELCWPSITNLGYQPQYRSMLTSNNWVPLFTNYWRGTGGMLCTDDAVNPEQPQRFYRIAVTNLADNALHD